MCTHVPSSWASLSLHPHPTPLVITEHWAELLVLYHSSFLVAVLAFYRCCNKLPKPMALNNSDDYLTVVSSYCRLEVDRSYWAKLRMLTGLAPSFSPLLQLPEAPPPLTPWLAPSFPQSAVLHLSILLKSWLPLTLLLCLPLPTSTGTLMYAVFTWIIQNLNL